MIKILLSVAACCIIFISCKTTTYYVVRHTEKAENTMTSDVPLSAQGEQRAQALKEMLKGKKIGTIYSTNYLRTRSTAKPLAESIGLTIQVYEPTDSTFISRIINAGDTDNEGNMLIVGHSNTVDDIVNKLMKNAVVPGDLPETQYGDLFIVKRKNGKYSFHQKRFGL